MTTITLNRRPLKKALTVLPKPIKDQNTDWGIYLLYTDDLDIWLKSKNEIFSGKYLIDTQYGGLPFASQITLEQLKKATAGREKLTTLDISQLYDNLVFDEFSIDGFVEVPASLSQKAAHLAQVTKPHKGISSVFIKNQYVATNNPFVLCYSEHKEKLEPTQETILDSSFLRLFKLKEYKHYTKRVDYNGDIIFFNTFIADGVVLSLNKHYSTQDIKLANNVVNYLEDMKKLEPPSILKTLNLDEIRTSMKKKEIADFVKISEDLLLPTSLFKNTTANTCRVYDTKNSGLLSLHFDKYFCLCNGIQKSES